MCLILSCSLFLDFNIYNVLVTYPTERKTWRVQEAGGIPHASRVLLQCAISKAVKVSLWTWTLQIATHMCLDEGPLEATLHATFPIKQVPKSTAMVCSTSAWWIWDYTPQSPLPWRLQVSTGSKGCQCEIWKMQVQPGSVCCLAKSSKWLHFCSASPLAALSNIVADSECLRGTLQIPWLKIPWKGHSKTPRATCQATPTAVKPGFSDWPIDDLSAREEAPSLLQADS